MTTNPGWFKPNKIIKGKLYRDARRHVGRRRGSKNKRPRALMSFCPRCQYRPGKAERKKLFKALKRTLLDPHGGGIGDLGSDAGRSDPNKSPRQ